jgi:hypothetical protein
MMTDDEAYSEWLNELYCESVSVQRLWGRSVEVSLSWSMVGMGVGKLSSCGFAIRRQDQLFMYYKCEA